MQVEGWIEPISFLDRIRDGNGQFKKGDKKDSRERYYKATPKGVYEHILQLAKQQKVKLTPEDENKLWEYLDGNVMRSSIQFDKWSTTMFENTPNIFFDYLWDITFTCFSYSVIATHYELSKKELSEENRKKLKEEIKDFEVTMSLDKLGLELATKLIDLDPNLEKVTGHVVVVMSVMQTTLINEIKILKKKIKKLEK